METNIGSCKNKTKRKSVDFNWDHLCDVTLFGTVGFVVSMLMYYFLGSLLIIYIFLILMTGYFSHNCFGFSIKLFV